MIKYPKFLFYATANKKPSFIDDKQGLFSSSGDRIPRLRAFGGQGTAILYL